MPDQTEPRVWREGDPEPGPDVHAVQHSNSPIVYTRRPWPVPYGPHNATTVWQAGGIGQPLSWEQLTAQLHGHTLTEFDDDPSSPETRRTPPDAEDGCELFSDCLAAFEEGRGTVLGVAERQAQRLANVCGERDLALWLHAEAAWFLEQKQRDIRMLHDQLGRRRRDADEARAKLDGIVDLAGGFHAFMLSPGSCNPDQVRTRAVSALDGIRRVFEGVTDREEPAEWKPAQGDRVVGKLVGHPDDQIEGSFIRHSSDWVSRIDTGADIPCQVLRATLRPASEELGSAWDVEADTHRISEDREEPAQHIGRSWGDHPLEDGCPCPQAPCGLVSTDEVSADCPEHPMQRGKTIRQSHSATECPALKTDEENR